MNENSANSRDQILEALTNPSGLTTLDLSRHCGIGEPAVRFHLRNLLKTGQICTIDSMVQKNHPGRKYLKYRRNNSNLFSNVHQLCNALLEILLEFSEKENPNALNHLAKNMIGDQVIPFQVGFVNLNQAIRWFNEHNYAAGWEASRNGPLVRFRNCPYRELGVHKAQICNLDQKLLETATGSLWEAVRTTCWESSDGECEFVVEGSRLR